MGWDPQSHAEFMRQLDAHEADNLTNFLPKIDANAVNAVTADDLKRAAAKYLKHDEFVKVTLLPEALKK